MENKLSTRKKFVILLNILTFIYVLMFFPSGYGIWGIWGVNIFSFSFLSLSIWNIFKGASQLKSETFNGERKEFSEIINSLIVFGGFFILSSIANHIDKLR